ncbi:MAG: hypothetical protein M3033_16960 [Acidobacteriota bacterium]|nr:hypothetical protein [Acidobacteriota bacterium]
MSDKLQKKLPDSVKEHSQYALGFGLIATMLWLANFPGFVIFFFAIFAYVLWKTFSQPPRNETREVFEFYLSANELLRDDERRWFGFEVQEVIARGERILQLMNGAPPLVYFTLGALYNKAGDYKSAVNHLAYVLENENADETTYAYPSPDLRNYVRILRKIEREPAEAPQTSAAIRALERARRNRGKAILDASRVLLKELEAKKQAAELEEKKQKELVEKSAVKTFVSVVQTDANNGHASENGRETLRAENQMPQNNGSEHRNEEQQKRKKYKTGEDPFSNRKPISELLHDIYDGK